VSWRRFIRRRWWDEERAREIESYLAIETADNIARGMTPEDAASAARRKFGNPALFREEIYEMNTIGWLESLWQDVRYGARVLRLNPGFFTVATLSLILGIGANTAIFQLLDAVRLRFLPVPHAEQLAELKIVDNDHCCDGNFTGRRSNFTYAQWQQIRDRQQAFTNVFAWGDHRFNLAERGEIQYAEGLYVSGAYFQTLAVRPLLGRLIGDADDRPGCGAPGAVIGYPFWQSHFGGDPQAVGRELPVEGHRFPVIGVAPAQFFGVEVGRSFDIALPLCAETLIDGERSHIGKLDHWWLAIAGRLKPGWTVQRAAAQAQTISRGVFESTIPNYRPDMKKYYSEYKLTASPAGSGVSSLRSRYEDPLYLLLAIAGLVLLIACANLANLMLARASAREREISVRLAIGAGRARLIRQLLSETALLTLAGTAGGVLLAQLLSRYLVTFLTTADNPLFLELRPDWRVLAFTAGTAILTCILFGLYPALRATRTAPAAAMKASGRGITGSREKFGLRRALVVGQVAMSVVLLVGALLFVRSLRNLLTLDAGFREDGLLITGVDLSRPHYSDARRAVLYRELLQRLRAARTVRNAASASVIPISGDGWNDMIEIPGSKSTGMSVSWFARVSDGYFATMGTPLDAGRDFNASDTTSSPDVAIVNEKFRDKYLDAGNPVGRQFRIMAAPGEPQHIYQIVGVVGNSKYKSLREDFSPTAFVAESQNPRPDVGEWVILRSDAPLGAVMSDVKRTVLGLEPDSSLRFQVFKTEVEESLLRERLMAALSGFFGFLAAVLATVGLYGVISYMVARRRNEIGIRIALGANRANVLRLVFREAAILLLAGLALGTALAVAAARTAGSLLYGLQPTDPLTIELAVGLLAVVALAASFVPAFRASRLNPMTALREE